MPSSAFDRRLTPARPDLAAAHLRGAIEATRFVEGVAKRIVAPSAPLQRAPDASVSLDTEALHGEEAVVYEEGAEWAWVQLTRDGYVGYLPSSALGSGLAPTHRVAAVRTHAYPGPSIKAPPRFALPLGALVAIMRFEGDFAVAADGAHYFARHLAPIDSVEPDFVAVAEKFLEAPYLWGGRTWEGLDCSGLTQTALTAAGRPCPRDTDMIEAALGAPLAAEAPLERGDLVFWKGHVGIMRDAATLIHANGFHMKVVSEPLVEARARIAEKGGGAVTSISALVNAVVDRVRPRSASAAIGARALLLRADAAETGVEARETAAAVHQLLRSAGPRRMRIGVDVEVERRALLRHRSNGYRIPSRWSSRP